MTKAGENFEQTARAVFQAPKVAVRLRSRRNSPRRKLRATKRPAAIGVGAIPLPRSCRLLVERVCSFASQFFIGEPQFARFDEGMLRAAATRAGHITAGPTKLNSSLKRILWDREVSDCLLKCCGNVRTEIAHLKHMCVKRFIAIFPQILQCRGAKASLRA